MSISSNYPASNPRLLLDFANVKRLDPRITFTRASIATYFNEFGVMQTAASGVARFDFNPTTLVSLGLLIEEQRTNLLLNSASFATQNVTVTAVSTTLSFYDTGTITLTGASTAGPLVGTGASNRVTLTFTPTAGTLTLTVTGSVQNAQLEVGAFATSYIPTVASQVTRAADLALMTGTNFSSWYNPVESTIYTAFVRFGTTGTPYPIGFSGGSGPTTVPRISLRTDTSMNIQTQAINSLSVTQWSSSNFAGSPGFNAQARAVMAFADNNIGGCVNGNAVTQISSGIVPTGIDKLFIGFQGGLNGHISKIAYYDTRVSNAQLRGLSS